MSVRAFTILGVGALCALVVAVVVALLTTVHTGAIVAAVVMALSGAVIATTADRPGRRAG